MADMLRIPLRRAPLRRAMPRALAVTTALAATATVLAACTSSSATSGSGGSSSGGSGASGTGVGTVQWSGCAIGGIPGNTLKCANLQVPLNYSDPGGRKITLALSEVPATAPKSQQLGDLVVNPGGHRSEEHT